MFTVFHNGKALPRQYASPLQGVTAVVVAFVLMVQAGFAPTLAQVSGNTYTSPQFGYSVTWDDTWFLVSEESSLYDNLMLTNGLTYCQIIGGPDPAMTPEAGLAGFLAGIRTTPGISDFAPLLDTEGNAVRGGDATRAFAAFTYTFTMEDGSAVPLANYIEVRLLVPGQSVVGFVAETLAANFESERPQFEQLFSTVLLPGAVSELDQPAAKGEPAPVFISGTWRVAIATSAVRETFPDIGLKQKSGKEWMLIVLDVTNWSEQDGALSARDFTIRTGAEQKPVKVAGNAITRIADQLGTAPFAANLTMAVGTGETVRVTLAFVIPADTPSPMLVHKGSALALDGIIESDLQASDLPASAVPPSANRGEIVSASDGQTIRVMFDGEQGSTRIKLLGVNPPTEDTCLANAAEKTLDDLAGSTVLVEEDSAVTGGTVPSRYVWLIQDDGTRTLLNQQLIAEGSAYAADLPADARFGAWLQTTEHTAEETGVGLWAGCSSTASADTGMAATPAAVPIGR
jgi:endonuclease YncB( thermonuclease family)